MYRLTPDAIIDTGLVGLLPLLPFTKGATPSMIEMAMRQVKAAIRATDPNTLTDLALAAGTESLEQLRARLGLSDTQG